MVFYGILWCDEGVLCLAMETQVLHPDQFGMLFISLGPFSGLRFYWGDRKVAEGFRDWQCTQWCVTDNHELAISSVLEGGDYFKAKDGVNIIAEAITLSQYKAFLKSENCLLN